LGASLDVLQGFQDCRRTDAVAMSLANVRELHFVVRVYFHDVFGGLFCG
jgi:hypothetical protein